MVTIPTTPPEPLTLLTALSSMKAINRIFKDQLSVFYQFSPIRITAPFKLTDFISFEEGTYQAGTKDQIIKDKLTTINKWALGNIQLYEKIQEKTFEGMKEKYYTILGNGDTHSAYTERLRNPIVNPKNPQAQVFQFVFDDLPDFCKKVYDFIGSCLENPFDPKLPMTSIFYHQSQLDQQQPKPKSTTGYPDKWYALYHMICLAVDKDLPRFPKGCSNYEIVNYGKNHYGTGDGFRKNIRRFDINNMVAEVRSLPLKDKLKWKKIIINISNNDADIISWVNKRPN
jgi:hypothetical protein